MKDDLEGMFEEIFNPVQRPMGLLEAIADCRRLRDRKMRCFIDREHRLRYFPKTLSDKYAWEDYQRARKVIGQHPWIEKVLLWKGAI